MSTFILELPLNSSISDNHALEKYFELSRKLYNALLKESLKRLNLMRQSRQYRNIKNLPKKEQSKAYARIQTEFKFTKNDMIMFSTPLRVNEFNGIDSSTTQKLAQRAFAATFKIMIGRAKRVYIKRVGEMDSIEGASNRQGIKYRNEHLEWNKLKIPVLLKKNDDYAYEALTRKIKYCRIVRKLIRGETRYYIQLVLEGIPPKKIDNETGMFKHKFGEGKVGIDTSLQIMAVSCETSAKIYELAPSINSIDKEKRRLQRKLDRQCRANNPHKFNEDGTIKKGNKDKWILSKSYIKTKNALAELQRKLASIRKMDHNVLANEIVSLGNEFYIEPISYAGLSRRSKETEKNKHGKFKSKKRYGKSISNKAPSMFINILKNKLSYYGLLLNEIDTRSTRASQYSHIDDTYKKSTIEERWKKIGNNLVQRDLYSAFLIMNVNSKLNEVNREKCIETWDNFLRLHDVEVGRLEMMDKKLSVV
ncbi:transposase [Paenibacillus cremeus]|uniref:Transposase n=1 Tax=Paenibacillus cremeus TaxID=2163881 RepID=A0A559KCP6_9BACL|nr:transposase [Paenibacillus cremeus]TVY09901.1 transposase [Paenibacillus cremeus]